MNSRSGRVKSWLRKLEFFFFGAIEQQPHVITNTGVATNPSRQETK
jgi:hypothetical protein